MLYTCKKNNVNKNKNISNKLPTKVRSPSGGTKTKNISNKLPKKARSPSGRTKKPRTFR